MTEMRIRKVDEWVVESLRQAARASGKTLEATIRELLEREAMRPRQELARELRQMQDELRREYGTFSDSTAIIREQRDAWG